MDTPDRTQATHSEGVGQEHFSLVNTLKRFKVCRRRRRRRRRRRPSSSVPIEFPRKYISFFNV